MKLRFTPRATEDLVAIADFIFARNPSAALLVRAAIYETLQNLTLYPKIGRQQKTSGVRKVVTRKYAYLIYYTVDTEADEIVILNVKHPARDRDHEDD